jgi:hypothetical protein
MGVSGQCHALAVLYPWEKDPKYSLDRRLGRPQSSLDAEARRQILGPPVDQTPPSSSLLSDTIPTELPQHMLKPVGTHILITTQFSDLYLCIIVISINSDMKFKGL